MSALSKNVVNRPKSSSSSCSLKGYAGKPQKIVFEVIQIPRDGLPVEDAARIAHAVIQIAPRLHLKPRQHGHHLAICLNRFRSDLRPVPLLGKKLEKCCVSQIFFQIRVVVQILGVNFRHGKPVLAKMPRKFQKRDVFFAPVIEHANRAHFFVADPYEFASRAAELPVKWLHPPRRRVEMLLEKFFENVHQDADPPRKQKTELLPRISLSAPASRCEPAVTRRSKKALVRSASPRKARWGRDLSGQSGTSAPGPASLRASAHSARRPLFAHLNQVTRMSGGMVISIIITVLLLWLVIGGAVAVLIGPLLEEAASRVPPSRKDHSTLSKSPVQSVSKT